MPQPPAWYQSGPRHPAELAQPAGAGGGPGALIGRRLGPRPAGRHLTGPTPPWAGAPPPSTRPAGAAHPHQRSRSDWTSQWGAVMGLAPGLARDWDPLRGCGSS
jgi:hypothetical protein